MKLGFLLIILLVAGAGTANGLRRFTFTSSFIYGGERGKATPVIFGAYDKDGAGLALDGNEEYYLMRDDDSFEINQCNAEETETADGKCNLLYEIDYQDLPIRGAKPFPAIFGAYHKDNTGWTVPKNLSCDNGLGRGGFVVSNNRCMYPCRVTFQRNKTKENETFYLSSLRIVVSETFRGIYTQQ